MVKYCNTFYGADGVIDKLSPRNIVLGSQNLTFKTICKMNTCMPVMVTIRRKKTNTMSTRPVEVIALNPHNGHGSWNFQSLATGKKIHSHIYNPLLISDRILNRVTELAAQDNIPCIQDGKMIFKWTPGDPIDDDDLEILQLNMEEHQMEPGAEVAPDLSNNQFGVLTDDDYDSEDDSDYEEEDNENTVPVQAVEEGSVDETNPSQEDEEDIDDIIWEVTANDIPLNTDRIDDYEKVVEDVRDDEDDDEESINDDNPTDEHSGRGCRQKRPNSKNTSTIAFPSYKPRSKS